MDQNIDIKGLGALGVIFLGQVAPVERLEGLAASIVFMVAFVLAKAKLGF